MHLNTKNDEYEFNVKSIINGYELEMETIITNSNSIINKLKTQLDNSSKNSDLEKQFKSY
jgi:hypothetical protein